jgi:hypothetical protein
MSGLITQEGTELFIGKTIASAKIVGCKTTPQRDDGEFKCDGENVLELTFTDGSSVDITGGYGFYTGASCGEYFKTITIRALSEVGQ